MDIRIGLLLAGSLAGNASAQQVYKCVEGGATVYQSQPCQAGAEAGTRKLVKDPRLSAQERHRNERMLADARARMRADAGYGTSSGGGVVIDAARDPEACDKAKWHSEMADAFGSHTARDKAARERSDACRR